jgi:hypothetical protein
MNCLCSVLLLVATTFLLASAKNVDNDESPGGISSKPMLQKSDPDQFLQLVAMKESNRDVSIPTVRARCSIAIDPSESASNFCLG